MLTPREAKGRLANEFPKETNGVAAPKRSTGRGRTSRSGFFNKLNRRQNRRLLLPLGKPVVSDAMRMLA
jgi:hypothetical protein